MSRVFNFLFVETTCEGDNSRGKRLRPGLFISAGHRVWHGDYYQHAATFFLLFSIILFSTNYLVSFEGGNVELGEHGEYHVMTTL